MIGFKVELVKPSHEATLWNILEGLQALPQIGLSKAMIKKGSQQTTKAPVIIARVFAAFLSRFASKDSFIRDTEIALHAPFDPSNFKLIEPLKLDEADLPSSISMLPSRSGVFLTLHESSLDCSTLDRVFPSLSVSFCSGFWVTILVVLEPGLRLIRLLATCLKIRTRWYVTPN